MTHTDQHASAVKHISKPVCVRTFYNKFSNRQIRNVDLLGGVSNFVEYSVPNFLYH